MKRRKHLKNLKISDRKMLSPVETRITLHDLLEAFKKFAAKYLDDVTNIYYLTENSTGIVILSTAHFAYAMRTAVECFCYDGSMKITFSERDDEFVISIEASALEDLITVAEVVSAFRSAGFLVKSYGFSLVLYKPLATDLDLLLRQIPELMLERELYNAFFL